MYISMCEFDKFLKGPLPSKIHNEENVVGFIDITSLFAEETRLISKKKKGIFDLDGNLTSVKIAVYGGERYYAHFHIITETTNKSGFKNRKFVSCPCLN